MATVPPTSKEASLQTATELQLLSNDASNSPSSSPQVDTTVTHITTKTSLSTLFKVVRALIRPFRPHLVQIGKEVLPAGSPRITKRPNSHYNVEILEREVSIPVEGANFNLDPSRSIISSQVFYLYDFQTLRTDAQMARDGAKREYRHTIYYFSGGGFQSPASAEHWKLCARMAKDLSSDGIRVVLVSYPLAPSSPAKDSLPLLRAWLVETLREANNNARTDETVTLMGDSSGGNIVLTLAFWWSEQLKFAQESSDNAAVEALKRLKSAVVMSPPTDFRNVNPDIQLADQLDPVLTLGVTTSAADAWCKDWPYSDGPAKSDPTLSVALAKPMSWQILRESGLEVNGLYGTADVLSPDCQVFMNRCKEEGIKGSWLVWEGQMHCFPITQCYGIEEGREGFEWLKERAREAI